MKKDIISFGEATGDNEVPYVRTTVEGDESYSRVGIARFGVSEGDPLKEGEECVHISHLQGNHYEVTKSIKSGPAMVNSAAYKTGWENLFGAKQTVGQS